MHPNSGAGYIVCTMYDLDNQPNSTDVVSQKVQQTIFCHMPDLMLQVIKFILHYLNPTPLQVIAGFAVL